MLAIKNNLMAAGASRYLGISYDALGKSVERLASGLRINSAKDDAAGLAVRELIRADVAALQQGSRNAMDGISMIQAAEGALGKIDECLIRMRELCEQANTDTYSSDQKLIMQAEFDELATEITRITDSTNFNDINMLNNTNAKTISLGQGAGTGVVSITAQKMDATTLALAGTYRTATGPTVALTTSNLMDGVTAADKISFALGGDTLDITIGAADKTITEVMDLINAASRGIQAGWNAASISGNATNGYQLVITAKTAGAVAAMVVDPDSDADGVNDVSWSAGVIGGTGVVATGDFFQVDGAGANLDITQSTSAATIDLAIKSKDEFRALLGYKMNRLEAAAGVLDVQAENLSAAESRISDVDVALEMSAMTRNQVLAQAGISMLSQANSMPQMALQLLQG